VTIGLHTRKQINNKKLINRIVRTICGARQVMTTQSCFDPSKSKLLIIIATTLSTANQLS